MNALAKYRRLLAGLLFALCVAPAAAEPLGRLFLAPERRALLERQRQSNVPQQAEHVDGAPVSLDGIVTRSTGKRTVWISGRPQTEAATDYGINVRPGKGPSEAELTTGESGSVRLKVGESIDWATREKRDALGGGRVAVKPAPTGR